MYRSDREIVQDLIPIRLFQSVVNHGHHDPESDEAKQILAWLRDAEEDALAGQSPKKAQSIARRAWRVHDILIKPFHDAGAAVAKFGLVSYYTLDKLRQFGLFQVVDGTPLDRAISALLHEDGTLVEFANIEKIDQSAQKQARHMLASLQGEGLFAGASWE